MMAYVKIPAGYRHAGRVCRVASVTGDTVTVFVPQKRRVLSSRVVPVAYVEFDMADMPDAGAWLRGRMAAPDHRTT